MPRADASDIFAVEQVIQVNEPCYVRLTSLKQTGDITFVYIHSVGIPFTPAPNPNT
jgi:hypothetical protein